MHRIMLMYCFAHVICHIDTNYISCRHLSQDIVDAVRGNGGRFLKYDKSNKIYVDIGNKEARAKTSQAFRDALRKEKKESVKPVGNHSGFFLSNQSGRITSADLPFSLGPNFVGDALAGVPVRMTSSEFCLDMMKEDDSNVQIVSSDKEWYTTYSCRVLESFHGINHSNSSMAMPTVDAAHQNESERENSISTFSISLFSDSPPSQVLESFHAPQNERCSSISNLSVGTGFAEDSTRMSSSEA